MPRSKVTEGLTNKEILFCESYANGVSKVKSFKSAFNSKADETKMEDMANKLLSREDIKTEIARQRGLVEKREEKKRLDEKLGETDEEIVAPTEGNIKWSQGVAFNRLKKLLDSCDSAMQLLKDRPKLFSEVRELLEQMKKYLNDNGLTTRNTARLSEMIDCMENIEDIVYKLSKFNIKEYNSTINTANGLMKEINALTGIKKSSQAIKNETFEDKLYRLISGADNNNDLSKELEEYAFSE